jgi:hypothetical protein
MNRPDVDDELGLLTDFGEAQAICAEVLDDATRPGSLLLKVMARGPFEPGQACWIVDPDGAKLGATVEAVVRKTADGEVTLSAVIP